MMLFALAQHSDAGYQEACGCCTNHEQYVFMCHLVHNEYISLMYYAQPTKANALIAKILDKTMSQNMEHMRDPSRFVMGCARAARHRVSQALHLTSIIDKQTLFLKFNFSQKILFKNTFRFFISQGIGQQVLGRGIAVVANRVGCLGGRLRCCGPLEPRPHGRRQVDRGSWLAGRHRPSGPSTIGRPSWRRLVE